MSPEAAERYDLPTPSFVPLRYRPGNLGTWSGHLAFAHDLIAATRPGLIVELGTHWGESYFTFCQSVFQNGLDCLCYAVDHWKGEQHAGLYGEDVFHSVQQYNEAHYAGFSYLLRTSFDSAASQFADGSIDILHIDGLHTYEAVSHDFRIWFPKVRPGGIILLHDIAVRHANFGVWRLWDELTEHYRETFAFHHWWGLGVLRKPGDSRQETPLMEALFQSSPEMSERVRRQYVMYTVYLESTQLADAGVNGTSAAADRFKSNAKLQAYLFSASGYSEEASISESIALGDWREVSLKLPEGNGGGPIRIDPADCTSIIDLRRIAMLDEATGSVLFSASEQDFRGLMLGEGVVRFESTFPCSMFSWSADPHFLLPAEWQTNKPARLEIALRVQASFNAAVEAVRSLHINELTKLEQRAAQAQHSEREARQELRVLQELLDTAEDRARDEAERAAGVPECAKQLRAAQQMLESERRLRVSMENSRSWAITKPLRALIQVLKR